MSIFDNIEKERNMSVVNRLALVRHNRPYTLAEHCYYTGLMFQELCDEYEIPYTLEDLKLVLRHDYLETYTCDLSYCVKNLNTTTKDAWGKIESEMVDNLKLDVNSEDRIKKLGLFTDKELKENMSSDDVYMMFKICDMFELFLFCLEEYKMGNVESMVEVLNNCKYIFGEMWREEEKGCFHCALQDIISFCEKKCKTIYL